MSARVVVALALATALGGPLSAQEWRVRGEVGRMRSTLDPVAATSSLGVGVRYELPTSMLDLSIGAPTEAVGSWWAGIAGSKRASLRLGSLVVGGDLSGSGFMTQERSERQGPLSPLPGLFDQPLGPDNDLSGHALALQALPLIGFEGGRVQVHARAGLSRYAARFQASSGDRTVALADVRLTLMPTSGIALMPVVSGFAADGEKAVTYAGVSIIRSYGRGTLWGSAGVWSREDTDPSWGVGAALTVHPRVSLSVDARRDSYDPLYLQAPQTAWSLGVSIPLGRSPRGPVLPVPAAYADGRATIRLPLSESEQTPSVAGDFNGWKPVPMQRTSEGWSYSVSLLPGVYHYAFVSDAGDWFVPESTAGRKEDGMGGHVAVLVVQ